MLVLFLIFSFILLSSYLSVSFVSLSFNVFFWSSNDLSLCLFLDYNSLLFSAVVCFIAINVMVFSTYYLGSFVKSSIFISLTFLFVISMLLLINTGDFFFLILGWDGLGVVSFFLILYYQSSTSIYSGLFTILVNRLGDSLFIVLIPLLYFYGSLPYALTFNKLTFVVSCIFLLGCMTKSALFPFSSWLPAAIAAPTPISALVHSSTLVTAGLYLILRFSYLLPLTFHNMILVVSIFTSFYAGLTVLCEQDFNNIVALSTLSHLGFISMAIFSGALSLAYYHLLAHALFNSLLFIGVGEFILVLSHNQDNRAISSGFSLAPASSLMVIISLYGLLGFPFVSGFYSNDFVLESLGYSNISLLLTSVIYLNVILTFNYSLALYNGVLSYLNLPSFILFQNKPWLSSIWMSCLSLSSVLFVTSLMWSVFPHVSSFVLSPLVNIIPTVLLLIFSLVIFYIFTSFYSVFSFSYNMASFIVNMGFLTDVISSHSSKFFLLMSSFSVNSIELGAFSRLLNITVPNLILESSSFYISLLSLSNFRLYLIVCALTLLILFLIV